ncbi:MAG: GspH/FimT family pseudopilin, partial [Pseudomonadota bacterium]|nr:GspH/FimT family pseudopilin [Pseudomonadota bacterium]
MKTARMGGARRQRGFTLVEMMVTLTVAAVMLTTSVPALRTFSQRNQASSAQSTFVASLALARAEAARRGSLVFVVAAPGGSTGNEYVNGWDLYVDANGNGSLDSGDGASIRHYDPPAGVVLRGAARITFNASG